MRTAWPDRIRSAARIAGRSVLRSAVLALCFGPAWGQEAPAGAPAPADALIAEIRELDSPPQAMLIDLTAEHDDLWDRIRTGFAMPDLGGALVVARQNWYAARPQQLKIIFERSKRYLYHIVEELEKRGMPTELALLPMVESAFNPMAYSRSHASGLWQFIPSTGKRYELQQNSWYDARRDILASTAAALDYLQFLYEMHGDWHLALASYNWGENAVARAIEKNRAKGLPANYLSLSMPSETRNYVPRLQALKNIIANPAAFGIDLDPIPNQPYFVTVPKTPDIDIKLAAKLAEMPVAELIALNPAYNRPVISAAQSAVLVLPADKADVFLSNLESHDEPLSSWETYTFKKGDRLEKLAAEHGISLAKLRQANAMSPRTQVAPGLQLLLPVKGSSAAIEPLPLGFAPPPAERGMRTVIRKIIHTVQRGDTLVSIAQRYKVEVDDLRRWNTVGRLYAGQKLTIERETTVSTWVRKPAPAARKPTKSTVARARG
jgi:membrane-bound lytic murein transglycosylase D